MTKILSELSLPAEIRTALRGAGGMFAYEKGGWKRLSRIAKNTDHSEETVPDCFVAASARATGITY
jgi:hypothetical protein